MQKANEFFKDKRRVLRIAVALLLLIVLSVGVGMAAKYRQELRLKGSLEIKAGEQSPDTGDDGEPADEPNETDTAVYVRAAVTVNWKDNENAAKRPEEGVDYTFEEGAGWFRAADGYYYLSTPVESEEEAPDISGNFILNPEAPEGFELDVKPSFETT